MPARAYTADPDYTALEMQAIASLLTDLVKTLAELAPGVLDRPLQISRLRLQQLEASRDLPVVDNEATILRFKISMLENGLGRPGTL